LSEEYIICRQIGTHSMYYSGCSHCMTSVWVDDPTAAIFFDNKDLAERTRLNIELVSNTPDFPLTLKPVRYTDEEENFDSSTDS